MSDGANQSNPLGEVRRLWWRWAVQANSEGIRCQSALRTKWRDRPFRWWRVAQRVSSCSSFSSCLEFPSIRWRVKIWPTSSFSGAPTPGGSGRSWRRVVWGKSSVCGDGSCTSGPPPYWRTAPSRCICFLKIESSRPLRSTRTSCRAPSRWRSPSGSRLLLKPRQNGSVCPWRSSLRLPYFYRLILR